MSASTVGGMLYGIVAGGVIGLLVVAVVVLVRTVVLYQRHGGMPLPAWLVSSRRASPELRELVARMGRAAAKDAMAEWEELPPGIKSELARYVRAEVDRWMTIRIRKG
jgi:hypothetical protein